jgi:hypothetical protein
VHVDVDEGAAAKEGKERERKEADEAGESTEHARAKTRSVPARARAGDKDLPRRQRKERRS